MRCSYSFLNWSIPRNMHNKIHVQFSIIFILLFGKINVRRAEAQGRGFHQDIPLKTINSGQSEIKICLMWVETVASFDQIQLRHFILYWWQAKLNNYYWIIGFGYYISGFLIGSANSGSSVSANRPNQLIWKLIPQALLCRWKRCVKI